MLNAFTEIIKARGWQDTAMAKILTNIHTRLKKRLPLGVEPSLTKFQKKAISTPGFWRDWSSNTEPKNIVVQGATSAGKTLLSELNILDTLRHDQKAIVLVPLKAMVHERTSQFKADMEQGLSEYGINVFGSSGDYMEYDEQLIHGEHDVAIIVYEKFFAMLSQGNTEIMKDCGLLIIDELSMIGSDQRGSKLEMAVEIVHRKYPDTRIMCLATCDCSTEKVCEWLDAGEPIVCSARPVALEEHIVELNGVGAYRVIPADYEPEEGDGGPERYEEKIEIPGYKPEWRTHEKKKQLLLAVMSKIYREIPDSRLLVFVASKSAAASVAEFLKDNISKWLPGGMSERSDADAELLSALEVCDRDDGEEKLIDDLIPYGIAYHHAGITTTLRELIEEQFSKPHSNLRVIVATETLTVGVNMPFDAMIMLDSTVYRTDNTLVPLGTQEYRNYIGRAGRLGQSNRIGKTYLFVEKSKDLTRYWDSYYKHDEVISSLTRSEIAQLAPYYLSLLNNGIRPDSERGVAQSYETTYNLSQIESLFEQSLSKICGSKRFDLTELHNRLYNAYLSDTKTGRSRGRLDTGKEYAITDFGTHMAPYALSMKTCEDIYCDFYKGHLYDGFPLDVTEEDIESDKYLLEILYHVCRHPEIEKSSNLGYPIDDSNLSKSYSAKGKVMDQLRALCSEKDEEGNLKNILWCRLYDDATEEDNELWTLLNKSNLEDEKYKLRAAMRAIVLYYWTKGYSIRQIREITKFNTFTKLISGDIERIAESASFHIDAIYKCLRHAYDPISGMAVYHDAAALKAFYALHTRVKYGMPRELVVFANKHIHGLDRQRLLSLKEEAEKNNLTPLQYLYVTPSRRISPKILTHMQQTQLRQALGRRGSRNINTMMEIIENDLTTNVTSDELGHLRSIFEWGSSGDKELSNVRTLYKSIKEIVKNPTLAKVEIYTDGSASKIIWRVGTLKLHIGVLGSVDVDEDVCEFFTEEAQAKLLIVPHSFSDDQMKSALASHRADCIIDNEYFGLVLSKTIQLPINDGTAVTEMLADLRGIFTKSDFNYFPMLRYMEKKEDTAEPKFRLIYGNGIGKRHDSGITDDELELALSATEDLCDFERLSWGSDLTSGEYDLTECPTVILLNRQDITRSYSLTQFIYKMRQQNFKNCLLLIDSENTEREWNSSEILEEAGNTNWSTHYNKIKKSPAEDVPAAVRAIRTFIKGWKRSGYLIGISYAHYTDSSADYNDISLINKLALKLAEIYGEDAILFDRFDPAKKLFDDNKGREKSLAAYKTCRFYLILWNSWTEENVNCRYEREVIFERCDEDKNKCMFLQTGRPNDPALPGEYFSVTLSERELNNICNRVKELIDEMLEND